MPRPVLITAFAAVVALLPGLAGCGSGGPESDNPDSNTPATRGTAAPDAARPGPGGVFKGGDCNGITDGDIARVAGAARFTKVVVNDAGCFWQENSVIGTFGAGMGISTWWYRGSDMAIERDLEKRAGRTLAEVSMDGNQGFKAYDANACSFYIAKGDDLITWSIQTMNPSTLPALCAITDELAKLSQDRVN
jgi:hypothetical protein